MSTDILSKPELLALGREAAESVAGRAAVEDVDVSVFLDSTDEPAYMFCILIDQVHTRAPSDRLYVELSRRLRDALLSRQDTHLPLLRILDQKDWSQRSGEQSVRA